MYRDLNIIFHGGRNPQFENPWFRRQCWYPRLFILRTDYWSCPILFEGILRFSIHPMFLLDRLWYDILNFALHSLMSCSMDFIHFISLIFHPHISRFVFCWILLWWKCQRFQSTYLSNRKLLPRRFFWTSTLRWWIFHQRYWCCCLWHLPRWLFLRKSRCSSSLYFRSLLPARDGKWFEEMSPG